MHHSSTVYIKTKEQKYGVWLLHCAHKAAVTYSNMMYNYAKVSVLYTPHRKV